MFTIYSESGSDSTMVSNLFIDEYMKSANDAQIKVYLYLLRMMGTHRATSVSDMADQFNHTEKDVVRSLRYWEKKGLLNLDFDKSDRLVSIRLCRPADPKKTSRIAPDNERRADANRVLSFSKPAESIYMMPADYSSESPLLRMAAGGACPAQASLSADPLPSPGGNAANAALESAAGTLPETGPDGAVTAAPAGSSCPPAAEADSTRGSGRSARALSEMEALESFRSNAGRAQLLFVIEQYIGKPLSLNEIRIIYNISEGLHFSDDMIDYLLQYCVDRGKKDFRYIRKVAENWAGAGIMTPAQAEQAAAQEPSCGRTGMPRRSGSAASGTSGGAQNPDTASDASGRSRKKTGRTCGRGRSTNSFNQFEQNDYDFDALEEELLQG